MNAFWLAEKRYTGHPEYPRHSEMTNQQNCDCYVHIDDENGTFLTTEINDKDKKKGSKEEAGNEKWIFLGGKLQ